MNVAALQKIDRWFGIPLCFALTLARKLTDFGPKRVGKPRNILFVKLAEQGSTVLAYPAIRRAVEMVGRENVYFIVFDENRFILEALELIPKENIIGISFASFSDLIASSLQAVLRMRKLRFDATIDMEFFARGSAAVAYMSGAKSRIGFHTYFGEGPYRGDLMTHRLLYNPHLHTSQIFQLMVESVPRDPDSFPTFDIHPPEISESLPQFRTREEEHRAVEEIIRRESRQLQAPPIILLNPNASDLLPLRRWANERYVELSQRLLARFPEVYIAFTGTGSESLKVNRMLEQIGSPRAFSLAGKTTLRQLLVLYFHSEILITNDSGPAHFGALTPIDVVTLFGPETPSLFATRTPRSTVLYANVVCSPCVNAYNNRQTACKNNVCMQQITVDQVFSKASAVYERRMMNKTALTR
jgi:ADP-heptose:LPS heptosyltransferase